MISITDFQNKGYTVPMPATMETVNGTHHKQTWGQTFGSMEGTIQYGPCVYKLLLDPAGTDTVFLPYYQNEAASVRLPTHGPRFFVTSNLSGCAIYIAKNASNRLVVIHSNSQLNSDERTMSANVPSYQSPAAASALDTYARNARDNHGGHAQIVAVLSKQQYLRAANRTAANGSEFLGGTTVAGWRTPRTNNWRFYYQLWGQSRGGPITVLECAEFYRNF